MSQARQLLIAGAGIGGLAAAVAAARAGCVVRLFERTPAFTEVGAGLQLGPNATRILLEWGLQSDLQQLASFPERLVARSAITGVTLGALPLGARACQQYGAPHATLHRADLHELLRRAAQSHGGVHIALNETVQNVQQSQGAVAIRTNRQDTVAGAALIGADGLHSVVRDRLLGDGPPRSVGDLAYRALLETAALPAPAQANQVTVWLGPDLHVVQYPVRAGHAMNLVVLVRGARHAPLRGWDHHADAARVEQALRGMCLPLRELVAGVVGASLNDHPWRQWVLADRPPLTAASQMARGRVALAGDAAHPMRPYMAQGAGMAIEDAAELAQVLSDAAADLPAGLRRYAENRWRRCARVQQRSIRNGQIFHMQGLMRLGRNVSMRLLGQHLMDVPWLYGRVGG